MASTERRVRAAQAGAPLGQPYGRRGFQRFKVSAFVTTLTLEKAIAAPAITGLRKPSAASGIPTTL